MSFLAPEKSCTKSLTGFLKNYPLIVCHDGGIILGGGDIKDITWIYFKDFDHFLVNKEEAKNS